MKAILEFQLPDEDDAYNCAIHGMDWKIVVEALDQELRNRTKYADPKESEIKTAAYQEIRDYLHELLRDENLCLYD